MVANHCIGPLWNINDASLWSSQVGSTEFLEQRGDWVTKESDQVTNKRIESRFKKLAFQSFEGKKLW